ncbi:TrlF family AAA-like ATPase [Shewanella sp. M-Br]|uniref:TrlF family AAA-like ATPase n=1 Tax=Shewanella sp. M-Br TaxID=2495595 RepID=UPI0029498899|nr:DNA repair ATPase [Shewanella sp. M-Br]
MANIYPRGSEWRKWDLHIHSPASFHWDGQKFNADPNSPENTRLIDEMIKTLNEAEPAVFAIMDYWTFDGWFALKKRLAQPDAPKLKKTVFPGIELRLVAPMEGRLNAHVLFSDKIDDQDLQDFKTGLNVALINRPLSDHSLKFLARHVGADLLREKGFSKNDVDQNDESALRAGSTIAEITCDSYQKAIRNVPNQMALGFMPFDTSDGLAEVKWKEHYSYVLGLFDSSPIFETRNPDLWAAFTGIETETNSRWFSNFQAALSNIPRLAVSGSDAHRFVGVKGNNDCRGYGDYPSEKATWIKANPTFEGLKQAIKEPAKRSFIGKTPSKIQLVNENRSRFIETLEVNKTENSTFADSWLDKTKLQLNHDLVAIIGNKGSGKSALADIVALLGNSKQSHHFSFLKANRFRGKTGEPAIHFNAKVTWGDTKELAKNLNENPATENVELVKYIPQGHFEELCNAHVSGQSDAFENELRAVIFSHADDSIRLGAFDFEQLIEQQESSLRSQIESCRSQLHKINEQTAFIENQLTDEVRKTLEELLSEKQRLLDELANTKPEDVPEPNTDLSPEQQQVSNQLAAINQELEEINNKHELNKIELTNLAVKNKACKNIKTGFEILKRAIDQFHSDYLSDATTLGLQIDQLVKIEVDEKPITSIEIQNINRDSELKEAQLRLNTEKLELIERKVPLSAQLNAPQQAFQQYQDQLKSWNEKKSALLGTNEDPDTLEGLRHRKIQLEQLPNQRKILHEQRLDLTRQIFSALEEQKAYREALFSPVQSLIQSNALIRNEYKLQFRAELSTTSDLISNKLFSLVKQASGEFRGELESISVIKDLMDKHDLNDVESMLSFTEELHKKLEIASKNQVGISSLLRKDRTADEVYDLIYGLEYIEPRYTLMFQDAQIEQLSPGQRGALLLIFYLLVDKGDTPIILDQPEENLDNETIVSLLVPVLTEAKQKRQIIMVTHNPNLAVVCDAEQIIHSEFDRTNGHKIKYTSGAIECSAINSKVVDVLEGTMPAFNNRRMKYL